MNDWHYLLCIQNILHYIPINAVIDDVTVDHTCLTGHNE